MLTRNAAVAGSFYPADPAALNHLLDQLLASEPESIANAPQPKALIVPHAGYIYSGPTASLAYQRLIPFRNKIKTVVLLGLSHRVPFRGIATTTASTFETPLGNIEIDRESIQPLIANGVICEDDNAHRWEHSLEVQLPFLQKILNHFRLIPLATGACSADVVAQCLSELWGDDHTLILVSSDLSHFHNYQEATKIDLDTCDSILNNDSPLNGEQACGCRGINGLLHKIKPEGYRIELIDYRNSGDTAGDKSRVVGYGAFAIFPSNQQQGFNE